MSTDRPDLLAPFPYFGGKRHIVADLWRAFGSPRQYIEPFCGSAAVLLGAPSPATLEVVGDANGFIANFWRAVVHQHEEVARWADYPVSHIDLGARHGWLMAQRAALAESLADPNWPGDAKVAGWWLWGQCAWIGSGWCEWERAVGQIPHVGNAGMGVQAVGQIPHVGSAGMGVQAVGKIPHVGNAGRGGALWTSCGRTALAWLARLADRLERVRVIHGDWSRCLNSHFGGAGADTAVFLDPPYVGFEGLYAAKPKIAVEVAEWARANAGMRIALCGHVGEHTMPGWREWKWERPRLTYGSDKTKADECVWFSPACIAPQDDMPLFSRGAA